MKTTDSATAAALSAPLEKRLETSVEIALLSSFYAGLLTQKQRLALRLHYEEDLSLGEIARQLQVSRQNVHELITRSAEKLRAYEAALGAARRMEDVLSDLAKARALVNAARAENLPPRAAAALREAGQLIGRIIAKQEEDDHGI